MISPPSYCEPSSPEIGQIYFNVDDKCTYYYDGNSWLKMYDLNKIYELDLELTKYFSEGDYDDI